MSMLVGLGLTREKVREADEVVMTDDAPEVSWADIDQAADATLLMEGLRLDADPADVPMFQAAYDRAYRDRTTSTR